MLHSGYIWFELSPFVACNVLYHSLFRLASSERCFRPVVRNARFLEALADLLSGKGCSRQGSSFEDSSLSKRGVIGSKGIQSNFPEPDLKGKVLIGARQSASEMRKRTATYGGNLSFRFTDYTPADDKSDNPARENFQSS